ncbi:MAG: zf-HC2 domain-containing protein [Chloroflexi bacterium]|nr:zf-HC2 domain-containing protein [Chloroflexota bacterium]
MRCPRPGTLRALLDGQTPAEDEAALREHLAACAPCRAALERERTHQQDIADRLALVEGTEPDPGRALARFHAQRATEHPALTVLERWRMKTMRRWRPLLAGASVLVLALLLVAVPPARAVAHQFLALFRAQSVVAVPVSPDALRDNPALEAIEEQLRQANAEVVADPDPVPVADRSEAEAMAGFAVREPSYLPGEGEVSFEVKGYTEYTMEYTRDMLLLLYELAGMDAALVPEDLTDGRVSGSVQAAVRIQQGSTLVFQAPSPEVQYPEGIDPRSVGEAGLRLVGYSARDARTLSERIDWTTTVVLPIPMHVAEIRDVNVAGSPGLLLDPTGRAAEETDSTLVWERGGILYMVVGPHDDATLVQIAESMF